MTLLRGASAGQVYVQAFVACVIMYELEIPVATESRTTVNLLIDGLSEPNWLDFRPASTIRSGSEKACYAMLCTKVLKILRTPASWRAELTLQQLG